MNDFRIVQKGKLLPSQGATCCVHLDQNVGWMISHKLSKGMHHSALLPCGLQVLYLFQRIANTSCIYMYSLCRFKCRLSVAFVLNGVEQIPHSFKSVSFSGDENAVKVLNSLTYSEYEKSE